MESDVTLALEMLQSETATISDAIQFPLLEQPMPDLAVYDQLLSQAAA